MCYYFVCPMMRICIKKSFECDMNMTADVKLNLCVSRRETLLFIVPKIEKVHILEKSSIKWGVSSIL